MHKAPLAAGRLRKFPFRCFAHAFLGDGNKNDAHAFSAGEALEGYATDFTWQVFDTSIDTRRILMTPANVTYGFWFAWLMSWTIAMLWSNRTQKVDAVWAELFFRVLFYGGMILLLAFPPEPKNYAQLWHFGAVMNWVLVAAVAAGLLFTWWARIHLGRLWSDRVVKKFGHRVVDTGPYRLVRHPIYSGLIFAALATAIQKATPFALLGVAMITLAFSMKARREERFLRSEIGESAYDTYARKTAMLVPFVRIGR